MHTCKLYIFGDITNSVSLLNKNKFSRQLAALFLCSIFTSTVIFLEPQFFFLRSPSLLLTKGLLWVLLLILTVHLHKHIKSSLDHLWSLSLLCWDSQGNFQIDFSVRPSGHRSRATHPPSSFACTSCFTQILEASIVPTGSFWLSFMKVTFVPSLERLLWTAQPTKVPGLLCVWA